MDNLKDKLIDELCNLTGILNEYFDIFGKKYIASIESKSSVLKAMGFDIDTIDSISREIKTLKELPWKRFIEPVYVFNEQPFSIHVYFNLEKGEEQFVKINWRLSSDLPSGLKVKYESLQLIIVEQRLIDNRRYVKVALPCNFPKGIEKFDLGYYSIEVNVKIRDKSFSGTSKVIVCPKQCYYPFKSEEDKCWGLTLNLYSLRSNSNWGVGDLGDLRYCIETTKKYGGAFVGINPLHSITNMRPYGISPYSPISKFYRNFIYINITEVEGFEEINLDSTVQNKIEKLNNAQYVDYENVAEIKFNILKKLFDWFYKKHYMKKSQLASEFDEYINKEGESLVNYALYCAIAEYEGKGLNKPIYSWRQWDSKFHSVSSKDSLNFKKKHQKKILLYCYMQWLIERQLSKIHQVSKPMPIGIYNDLAVGSIRDGSDEWLYQDVFASLVNAGAPPDDFNTSGQDWGFPPLCPIKLRKYAYEPLILTLRKNMQYAGALRIDHALGLFRMFWIPLGSKASDGVYVEYPYEEILSIIALESHLNKTIIIAEDLGTVTDLAKKELNKYKMLSYKLLYFQRKYPDANFVHPDDYPENALCAITTHDLPTIKGFWKGIDIDLRKTLSFIKDDDQYKQLLNERQRDKKLLLDILRQLGIIDFDIHSEINTKLIIAIYEFLARTKSMLLSISIDDIMETINQQNMPGTVEEYPCWIQKTPKVIEDFFEESSFGELIEKLNKNSRNFKSNI